MRLYIRHAIGGRLFLDTEKHQAPFQLEHADGFWRFTLHVKEDADAEDIVRHRHELNLFLIEEGELHKKSWFYSRDGLVEYDKEAGTLLILADSRMDYPV